MAGKRTFHGDLSSVNIWWRFVNRRGDARRAFAQTVYATISVDALAPKASCPESARENAVYKRVSFAHPTHCESNFAAVVLAFAERCARVRGIS